VCKDGRAQCEQAAAKVAVGSLQGRHSRKRNPRQSRPTSPSLSTRTYPVLDSGCRSVPTRRSSAGSWCLRSGSPTKAQAPAHRCFEDLRNVSCRQSARLLLRVTLSPGLACPSVIDQFAWMNDSASLQFGRHRSIMVPSLALRHSDSLHFGRYRSVMVPSLALRSYRPLAYRFK
jgi:hypothetical protein